MKLYEIDRAIMECIDTDTGEVLDFEKLDALQMERDAKIEGIALAIKNLNAVAAEIRAEEIALAERRKAKENKAERLKEFLSRMLNGDAFETARVRLSFRKSSKVYINDEPMLIDWLSRNSEECLNFKKPEVNKSKLSALIKTGAIVPGAEIVEAHNMQIK